MSPEAAALVVEHRAMAKRYAYKLARVCAMQEYADDAVSEAYVGLVEAARRFEPERGLRFGTYAAYWIRNEVIRFLTNNKYALKQSNAHRPAALAIKITRVSTRLYAELEREPTREDYAIALGVPEREIEAAQMSMRRRDIGITPCGEADVGAISPGHDETPEVEAARREEAAIVHAAIASFGEREADVLRRRLMDYDTLELVGRGHGLSRERVRQIQAKHQPALRARLTAALGGAS